jgi:hexokinase
MATYLVNLYAILNDLSKQDPERPRQAVMVKLSQALLAALKTLTRSTLRIRQIISSWLTRLTEEPRGEISTTGLHQTHQSFLKEVDSLFGAVLDPAVLLSLSEGLHQQFKAALVSDARCMLPSYNHQLPSGQEKGRFLALDVGGSTFRVALIELLGSENVPETRIVSQASYRITNTIKQLEGTQFFDWLAEKIEETILGGGMNEDEVIFMGLAWSFPIEYGRPRKLPS